LSKLLTKRRDGLRLLFSLSLSIVMY